MYSDEKQKSILILGSFSGNNFGDNIVLEAIINSLREEFSYKFRFLVPTNRPDFIKERFKSAGIIPIDIDFKRNKSIRFLSRSIYDSLDNVDLIITTAGILFDYKLFNPRFNFIITLLPLLLWAKKIKKKSIVGWGVGISPPTSLIGGYLLKKTLQQHDYIVTRDIKSQAVLERLTPETKSINGCDVAHLLLEPSQNIFQEKNNIIVGINITKYIFENFGYSKLELTPKSLIADIVKIFENHIRISKVIFISTTKEDHKFVENSLDELRLECEIECIDLTQFSIHQMNKIFGQVDYFVGTRLHSTIISTSLGIPTIGLEYHPKVRGYFDEIDMGFFCIGKNDIAHSETISEKIEQLIFNSNDLKEKLNNIALLKSDQSKKILNITIKEILKG